MMTTLLKGLSLVILLTLITGVASADVLEGRYRSNWGDEYSIKLDYEPTGSTAQIWLNGTEYSATRVGERFFASAHQMSENRVVLSVEYEIYLPARPNAMLPSVGINCAFYSNLGIRKIDRVTDRLETFCGNVSKR